MIQKSNRWASKDIEMMAAKVDRLTSECGLDVRRWQRPISGGVYEVVYVVGYLASLAEEPEDVYPRVIWLESAVQSAEEEAYVLESLLLLLSSFWQAMNDKIQYTDSFGHRIFGETSEFEKIAQDMEDTVGLKWTFEVNSMYVYELAQSIAKNPGIVHEYTVMPSHEELVERAQYYAPLWR